MSASNRTGMKLDDLRSCHTKGYLYIQRLRPQHKTLEDLADRVLNAIILAISLCLTARMRIGTWASTAGTHRGSGYSQTRSLYHEYLTSHYKMFPISCRGDFKVSDHSTFPVQEPMEVGCQAGPYPPLVTPSWRPSCR